MWKIKWKIHLGLNSRFEQTEERVSEFQDKSLEIIQSEEQNEEKDEEKWTENWGTPSNVTTHSWWESEQRAKGEEKLKTAMAPDVLNLMKNT